MYELRRFEKDDIKEMAALFHDTVHSVCISDYSPEQLDAWASGKIDEEAWTRSLLQNTSLVCIEDGKILGFGDMQDDGLLQRLYVHKDHIRIGIGTAIVKELERRVVRNHYLVYSSKTAVPFYESIGYRMIRRNEVVRNGVTIDNYLMEKTVNNGILVVYYSLEGNSAFTAISLSSELDCDHEVLRVEKQPPKKGFMKFFSGGKSAIFDENPGLKPIMSDLYSYDTIIMVFPIWAGTYPPAISYFLKDERVRDKFFGAVACSGGGDASKCFSKLAEMFPGKLRYTLSLKNPLADQQGTLEKVREFAESIKKDREA